jgi:hypothetical protein
MDLAMKTLLGPVLLNKKKEKNRLPTELYDEHIFVENDHYSYCSQRQSKLSGQHCNPLLYTSW